MKLQHTGEYQHNYCTTTQGQKGSKKVSLLTTIYFGEKNKENLLHAQITMLSVAQVLSVCYQVSQGIKNHAVTPSSSRGQSAIPLSLLRVSYIT